MSHAKISRRAESDLLGIGRHIAQHNEPAAKRLTRKLRDVCKSTIGQFPKIGTQRDELLPGMRCFAVGNYVIFFRGEDPVVILRILHGAMDFDQLTFDE